MPHVILSLRAQSDISRLHANLHEKNVATANRAILVIREAFIPLKQFPAIGRPLEDRPDFRELVIDFGTTGYLALYCYELDVVTILAVKHQREDDYK